MNKKDIYTKTLELLIYVPLSIKYNFKVKNKLPKNTKNTILIGNHTSFIDWIFLQVGTEQKIHFFIEKEIYEKPLFRPFLSFFGALPIDGKNAKKSMQEALQILKNGGVVLIFPEGELTKNGEISEFKKGFEFLAKKSDADIVPFYLHGLFGSRFSKRPQKKWLKNRNVELIFGEKLEVVDTAFAKKAVSDLRLKLI